MADPQRRELHFDSLEEATEEVERLSGVEVSTTGNFSFSQILEHLARTLDVVSGHRPTPKAPLPLRLVGRILRPRVSRRPMKPGIKLPSKIQTVFWPTEDVDLQSSLAHFRESVERYRNTDPLPPHPVFGPMTREECDQLQCRHCELHLSFVHPESSATGHE